MLDWNYRAWGVLHWGSAPDHSMLDLQDLEYHTGLRTGAWVMSRWLGLCRIRVYRTGRELRVWCTGLVFWSSQRYQKTGPSGSGAWDALQWTGAVSGCVALDYNLNSEAQGAAGLHEQS